MIEFIWPWAFWVIPAPMLFMLLRPAQHQDPALRIPFFDQIEQMMVLSKKAGCAWLLQQVSQGGWVNP